MEDKKLKQVIVMRTDLGMRKGKMIAQGAHASMKFLCAYLRDQTDNLTKEEIDWLNGSFIKICVDIGSEQELRDLMVTAKGAGLTVWEIVDNGATEFHGVPTLTCCAIGPHSAEKLDQITGGLKLL